MTEEEKEKKALRDARYETMQRERTTLPTLRKELDPMEADVIRLQGLLSKATEKRDAKLAEVHEQEYVLTELAEASEILKMAKLYRDSGLPELSEEEVLDARGRISRYTGVNSVTSSSHYTLLTNGY